MRGHLTGDAHQGGGIDLGIGDPGNQVGGPGAGSCQAYPDLVGRPRISLCGVCGSLFVANQDVGKLVGVIVEGIVDGHDGPSRISEKDGYLLFDQASYDSISPRYDGHFFLF